jgi:hypothetical protein
MEADMRALRMVSIVALAAFLAAGTALSSLASTFMAWEVTGISSNDVLMVRAHPSASSRILVGYPNGVMLSMTGRCTGDVRLDEIGGLSTSQQRAIVRSAWCEVWLDPYGTGEFRNGWVFGRYIAPA